MITVPHGTTNVLPSENCISRGYYLDLAGCARVSRPTCASREEEQERGAFEQGDGFHATALSKSVEQRNHAWVYNYHINTARTESSVPDLL